MRTFLTFLLSLALLAPAAHARSPRGTIALTFDDLPGLTQLNSQDYVDYINLMILRGLRRHHFPATGFVNEGKLALDRPRQIANLRRWLDAGMDLGNHTFSHNSPNQIGAQAYVADIARGEPVIRELLAERHRRPRWFRYPYLETGSPEPVKREIEQWLAAHGYRNAPVTIDADDWEFAEPYDDAIARHDEPRRQRIRAEYLAYTERTIGWYREAARALFGRDIAYVMLLHATRLNADSMEELAAILRRQRLRPVTLDRAMEDPAYRTRDPYSGKDGIEWLERWSMELNKPLPWATFEDVPKPIQQDYQRVDPDQK